MEYDTERAVYVQRIDPEHKEAYVEAHQDVPEGVTDAMERGVESYDLVGANEERLCGYKAKFAPELRSHYSIQKGTKVTKALSSVYKKLR